MISRSARLVGMLLLGLSVGCASPQYEGAFDPALFPQVGTEAGSRTPGRVALLVLPQVQELVYEGTRRPAYSVRVPVGRIVEEAVRTALGEALQGGAQRVNEAPAAGTGFAATLVIEAVRVEHDSKLLWIMPLPVYPYLIGDSAAYAQLAFDLRVLDAQGRPVWTRTYDSGREIYKRPALLRSETLPVGLVRMAHESAWRLSRQVVVDLRDALAAERSRPREL